MHPTEEENERIKTEIAARKILNEIEISNWTGIYPKESLQKDRYMGNPRDYYRVYSQNWRGTHRAFSDLLSKERFFVELKEEFFINHPNPDEHLDSLAMLFILGLWNEATKPRNSQTKESYAKILEQLKESDDPMIEGVINLVSDKLKGWSESVVDAISKPDPEIRKGMRDLLVEIRETREVLESMRELLSQRTTNNAPQLQTTINHPVPVGQGTGLLDYGDEIGEVAQGRGDRQDYGATNFVNEHGRGS